MKKVLILFLVLFTCFIAGCQMDTSSEITRTKEGVTITLPTGFQEFESDNWEVYYESADYAFMSKRVIKSKYPSNFHGEEYIHYLLQIHELQASVGRVDGVYDAFYYCYYIDYADEKPTFGYMMLVFESEDYFYLMNFSSVPDKFQDAKVMFLQYALTIKVK